MRKWEIRITLRSILSFWCMQPEGHTNYIKQAPALPIDEVQRCGPAEKFLETLERTIIRAKNFLG